jgi:MoaA/NifB/PqqE/SkfB family radical SAM enzyme
MQPVQVLYLHGMGEPLLNSEICEIIAYAKASGIFNSIVLITNGVLLSSNLLGTLSKAGLDEIRVSYDIFTPEKYLQLKGKDYSILVRSNIEECLDILRTGNDSIKFTIECKRWLDENNDLSNETDYILEYFHDLVAAVTNARFRIAHEFDWNGQAGCTESHFRRTTPCEQPFYMLAVHWNGHVSPCCIDTKQAIAVGNIFEVAHLNDIISGWKLRAVRVKLLTQDYTELELCRTCNVRSAVDDLLLKRSNEILGIL